jgi:hypothetical protein
LGLERYSALLASSSAKAIICRSNELNWVIALLNLIYGMTNRAVIC